MSTTRLLSAARASVLVISLFIVVSVCSAADNTTKRLISAPRELVTQALEDLQASSGGKLPTLYGFVDSGTHSLEHYEQGYYQYEIRVTSVSASETSVQVSAKVTAWYSDADPKHSAYHVLASNGRLESDLLERLESTLKTAKAVIVPPAALAEHTEATAESLPDAPSVTRAAAVAPHDQASTPVPKRTQDEEATERNIRQLTREAKALEEVRRNQSKPTDLAVVMASNTHVLSRPAKEGQTILIADADDELQVLDMNEEWVHVHLLGPSRGWVRRSQLDVSGVSVPRVTAGKAVTSDTESYHKTREETGKFPGSWKPLQGKQVQIVWIEPGTNSANVSEAGGMSYLQSLFRRQYHELSKAPNKLDGIVVVLDSEDGGMVATTLASLQRWNAGSLSDRSFLKECWFDPPDVFHGSTAAHKTALSN